MPFELGSEHAHGLSWRSRAKSGESSSWVLLFVDGLLIGCTAFYWMVRGHFFDTTFYKTIIGSPFASELSLPPKAQLIAAAGVRLAGFLGVSTSVFILGVATTSFRRGERWAWYAMWTLPLLATLDFALTAAYGALSPFSTAWDLALLSTSLLALVASYRTFFHD